MPQSIMLKHAGLYTYPNPLSAIPEGALLVAKNINIDRSQTAEPRRGFSILNYPLGNSSSNRADQLVKYGDNDLLVHYGSSIDPNKLAFSMFEKQFTGTISTGSNIVNNLISTEGYYSSAIFRPVHIETIFQGNQTLGSATITNILSTQGLFVGQEIGGRGVPLNTTILSIAGVGPYTITISTPVLYTSVGNTLTVSNRNLLNFTNNTRAVVINSGDIVLDNNSPYTSRAINFNPADVSTLTNTIESNNHGLTDGQQIQLSSSGTLPAGLFSGTVYYIVQSSNNLFKLSLTPNGANVNITDQGAGVHTLTVRDVFSLGGWIDYPGEVRKPEGNIKIRYTEHNNSLFITTRTGIRKLDNTNGIFLRATVTDGSDVITNTDLLNVTIGEFVSGPGIPDGSVVTDLISANSFEISNIVTLPTGVVSANNQLILVQPRLAGMPYALDGEVALTTDFTGFLPSDRAVQYFIVWGYKDANNRIARSAPSAVLGMLVSNNTSGFKNVRLRATIPDGITPAHFYQVYRSGFSADAQSIPPSDARLIYEANPTFTEVINNLVSFDDNVPEELRSGEILYTSEGQEGRLLGNFPPPFGTDIASFKDSLFISNTRTKHNLTLTILAVSGSYSILGDTNNSTPFKSLTISNVSNTFAGDVTLGSSIITNISAANMQNIGIGASISGTGIPAGTFVTGYENSTSIRITNNATANAVATTITIGFVVGTPGQSVSGSSIAANTKVVDSFFKQSAITSTVSGSPMLFDLSVAVSLKAGQPVVAASSITAGTLVEKTYLGTDITFINNNVNHPTNTFSITDHGLENGNVITFTGGSLPTGITAGTPYYVISAAANTFQISISFGGGALSITSAGSGFLTLSPQVRLTDNATATTTSLSVDFTEGLRIDTAVTATSPGIAILLKDGTDGVEVGDTLTIAGVTYTASGVEDYTGANRNFRVYTQGTPAQNITNTTLSLIRVINRQNSLAGTPDIYARYTSSINDLPGQFAVEARTFLGGLFYATANTALAGEAYNPSLPATGGTNVASKNDTFKNYLAYSKSDLPEAFPLGFSQPIGNEKSETIRIVPLRDSLFNLKEDGVFRVTGEDPFSFRSSIFDNTIKLAAPESVAALSNIIFALSTEGVVAITDSNSQVISRPIEDIILDPFEEDFNKVRQFTFGYAYDSEKKYILHTITRATDLNATQAFVYNVETETWTTWELNRTCGLVFPGDDLIYSACGGIDCIRVERKERRYTDYTDSNFEVNILAIEGTLTTGSNTITSVLPSSTHLTVGQSVDGTGIPAGAKIIAINDNFTITISKAATISDIVDLRFEEGRLVRLSNVLNTKDGDVLYQNDGRFSIIANVDIIKSTVLTRNPVNSWVEGSATIFTGISTQLQYAPQTCGNPSSIKQVTEFIAMFQTPFFDTASVSFSSDISGGEETITMGGQIGGILWGFYSWGATIWGGIVRPAPLRTLIPRDKQRNTQLNITIRHSEAFAFYRLSGIQLYFNRGNQRVRR